MLMLQRRRKNLKRSWIREKLNALCVHTIDDPGGLCNENNHLDGMSDEQGGESGLPDSSEPIYEVSPPRWPSPERRSRSRKNAMRN